MTVVVVTIVFGKNALIFRLFHGSFIVIAAGTYRCFYLVKIFVFIQYLSVSIIETISRE